MNKTWLIFTFILALAPDALAQSPLVWGQGQWGVNTWSADADNDLIPDDSDTYPDIPIGDLIDTDGDGAPDDCDQACIDSGMAADTDDDNDGVLDTADAFPLDADESVDTDGDGIGNNADTDDDGDGVIDIDDPWPLDKRYSLDTDEDGMPDTWESRFNLNSNDAADAAEDTESDGLTNLTEFLLGTSPLSSDSDRDTLPDSWEVANSKNPAKANYKVSTSGGVTCAIDDEGVICWGREWYADHRISSLSSPYDVSVGGNGLVCILDDTGAKCLDNYANSAPMHAPILSNPTTIGAGYVSCALDDEGVQCWTPYDFNEMFDPPSLSNPRQLSVGRNHACVIDDYGLQCWITWYNSNEYGQEVIPDLQNPRLVAAGMWSTCAIDDTGLVCWGLNNFGQINPPQISAPSLIAGGQHYCSLDGQQVVCWGRNYNNELNIPDGLDGVAALSANTDGNWWGTSCALGVRGVTCWGKSSTEIQIDNNNKFDGVELVFDPDGDGYSNQFGQDAFPLDATEWLDSDHDGVGNNRDLDDDNDGVVDAEDTFPLDPEEWADSDGDGLGDNADAFPNDSSEQSDADQDGTGDNSDNCLTIANEDQLDTDEDGNGDVCDLDDDNDGLNDDADAFPLDSSEQADTDGDGLGDNYEIANGLDRKNPDSDSDGVSDGKEVSQGTDPLDPISVDTDGDGILNNADEDDDNDGYSDEYELETGTDPLDPADFKPPYDDLNGIVYHWSKHIALPEVTVSLTSAPEYPPLSETTDDFGKYQFLDTPESTVELSLSLEATDIKRTINAGDALAALKIAVGLNPNSDPDGDGPLAPIPVSPYQLVAADLDQDGKVTAGDALAILKVAVGLSSAIAPTWAFVEDGTPVWETHSSRNKTYVVPEGVSMAYPEQTAVNFAAVLRGDVDSSWAVEGNAVSADYFSERAAQTTAPLSLWGIRDTDGDGLSDTQEDALGTAIDDADTDDDGVNDAQDLYPLDPDRSEDAPVGMSMPKLMGELSLNSVQPVTLHAPVLLRGDMNDWGTGLAFEKKEDGSYSLKTTIDAGTYTFKIASDNWAVMDLGAASESERRIELGKPVDLAENAFAPFIIELNGKAQLIFEITIDKQLIVTESILSEKTP